MDDGHDKMKNSAEKDSIQEFRWFIVQVMSGQENKICKALRETISDHKLSDYFDEIIIPEEEVISYANAKKRRLKKKIYPGYMLIRMILNNRTWHLVKNMDKVTCFVGGTLDKPTPLSEEEATYMMKQLQEGFSKTRTSIDFTEGDSVKVSEGPFTNFIGTVETVNEKGKIKVNVSIFGRPTPVELDVSQVEKIGIT